MSIKDEIQELRQKSSFYKISLASGIAFPVFMSCIIGILFLESIFSDTYHELLTQNVMMVLFFLVFSISLIGLICGYYDYFEYKDKDAKFPLFLCFISFLFYSVAFYVTWLR